MNSENQLFCLIGENISHSLSPAIYNAAFEKLKINAEYICVDVDKSNLQNAIKGIRKLGIKGANITMPHKTNVIRHIDIVDSEAEKIGAINTIVNRKGILLGFNTDGIGCAKAIEEKTKLRGKTATVIGCGGAGRAMAFELSKKVNKINLLSTKPRKVEKFAKKLKGIEAKVMKLSRKNLEQALNESDILINATPVGMKPNKEKSIVPRKFLHSELIVFDAVYNPVKTKFIKDAEKTGCIAITGDKMLVFQAAESFRHFTGRKAPVKLMQQVVEMHLGAKK